MAIFNARKEHAALKAIYKFSYAVINKAFTNESFKIKISKHYFYLYVLIKHSRIKASTGSCFPK